jgi:hypothetical protein
VRRIAFAAAMDGQKWPAKNRVRPIFQLEKLFFFCSYGFPRYPFQEVTMDDVKQRELIRLWNQMRKAQGPIAEEIRIQILAQFERVQSRAA